MIFNLSEKQLPIFGAAGAQSQRLPAFPKKKQPQSENKQQPARSKRPSITQDEVLMFTSMVM